MPDITYQQQRAKELEAKLQTLHEEAQQVIQKAASGAINDTEFSGGSANATYNATSEMDSNHEQYMQQTNERDDSTYKAVDATMEDADSEMTTSANNVDVSKI